jgi:hypothetical protein
MALTERRHPEPATAEDRDRIEVSEMTAAGVAAYADSREDDAYLERRGGKTFLVTPE